MYDIPCVIFAGGKSRRMGEDKALLPFGGFETLTQFQLAKFKPHFKKVYIGCKSKTKFDFEANFIEDLQEFEDSAPHVGLISAFETLDADAIFVLSVDAPFFNIEHFERLYQQMNTHEAIVAKSPNGEQPLCAIYKKSVLPHLKVLTEEKKYRFSYLFEKIDVKFVGFEYEEVFTNLNTPEDYEKAKLENIPHYTYEDYKHWENEWEIIDGIAYAMSPAPMIKHQSISSKIARILDEQVKNCDKCHALLPVDWKISEDTVVQPDNLIVCYEPKGAYLTKAPTMIFEILSKSTAKKDKTVKFELYEDEGVKYYIIVNPDENVAKAYELKDGRYIKMIDATDESVKFELGDCETTIDFGKLWG